MVAEHLDSKKNLTCCSATMLYLYRVEGKEPLGTKELTEIMVKAKERQSLVNLFFSSHLFGSKIYHRISYKACMG